MAITKGIIEFVVYIVFNLRCSQRSAFTKGHVMFVLILCSVHTAVDKDLFQRALNASAATTNIKASWLFFLAVYFFFSFLFTY